MAGAPNLSLGYTDFLIPIYDQKTALYDKYLYNSLTKSLYKYY